MIERHGENLTQMKQGVNWRRGPMWSVQVQVGGQSEEEIAKRLVPLRMIS